MAHSINDKLSILIFFLSIALAGPAEAALISVIVLLITRALAPPFRPLAQASRRRFLPVFLSLVLLACLMTIVNGLLLQEGEVFTVAGLSLYEGGIRFGVKTGARLLLIATSLLVFFGSVTIPHLASSLQHAGLPTQIVMTVLLTVYFLETIPERITRIFSAQEARGAPVRSRVDRRVRSFLSILAPLILSGIVESIERGTALTLRGYRAGTRLEFEGGGESRLSGVGKLFIVLSFFVFILAWVLP
ncbi:MAG: hypothetical protein HBSIN02_10300 [Bacteroidia bacterium]|nr:MAG: hypothetical protein HBSIN02_10300 [Bacteroidia bacterium]